MLETIKTKIIPLTSVFALSIVLSACSPQAETPAANTDTEPTNAQAETTTENAENATTTTEVATTAEYESPAGPELVRFVLFVDDAGTVVDAKTEVLAKAPISIMRQESFQKDFPEAVIGKKIAGLENIDRVGGSSLTTGAFNNALAELKEQL